MADGSAAGEKTAWHRERVGSALLDFLDTF